MSDVASVTLGLIAVNVVLVIVTICYVKAAKRQIQQSEKFIELGGKSLEQSQKTLLVDTTIQLMYHTMELMARGGTGEEFARAYILGTYDAFTRIDPEVAKVVEKNWRSWAKQQTWLNLKEKAKRIVEDLDKAKKGNPQ